MTDTGREFKVQMARAHLDDLPAWVASYIKDCADRLDSGDYTVDDITITATCTAVTR